MPDGGRWSIPSAERSEGSLAISHDRSKVDSYPGYWTTRDDCRTPLALSAAKKLKV